jgi:hypothetical protein
MLKHASLDHNEARLWLLFLFSWPAVLTGIRRLSFVGAVSKAIGSHCCRFASRLCLVTRAIGQTYCSLLMLSGTIQWSGNVAIYLISHGIVISIICCQNLFGMRFNWSLPLRGHVGAHNGNGVLASKLIGCQAAQFHVRSAFHATTFHHEFLGRVRGGSHECFQVDDLPTRRTSLVQSNDACVVILRLFLATKQWRIEGPTKL